MEGRDTLAEGDGWGMLVFLVSVAMVGGEVYWADGDQEWDNGRKCERWQLSPRISDQGLTIVISWEPKVRPAENVFRKYMYKVRVSKNVVKVTVRGPLISENILNDKGEWVGGRASAPYCDDELYLATMEAAQLEFRSIEGTSTRLFLSREDCETSSVRRLAALGACN